MPCSPLIRINLVQAFQEPNATGVKMMKLALIWSLAMSLSAHASETRLSVPLMDRGTGTLYVAGKVGNEESVNFLVDTGSSFSTINQKLLERLQVQGEAKYLRTQVGTLADGTRIEVPLYQVRHLQIGNSCTIEDIEVAVFPNNRRVILGLNVLSRISPFAISVDPPRLSMAGCNVITADNSNQIEPSLAALPQKVR